MMIDLSLLIWEKLVTEIGQITDFLKIYLSSGGQFGVTGSNKGTHLSAISKIKHGSKTYQKAIVCLRL